MSATEFDFKCLREIQSTSLCIKCCLKFILLENTCNCNGRFVLFFVFFFALVLYATMKKP